MTLEELSSKTVFELRKFAKESQITLGTGLNKAEIGQKIAGTYGVSEPAAFVHMKRCGLIRTEDPKEYPLYIRRGIAV